MNGELDTEIKNFEKCITVLTNILLSSRGKELEKVWIIEASSDKLLSCELTITVDIHSPEDVICSSLRGVELVTLKKGLHL